MTTIILKIMIPLLNVIYFFMKMLPTQNKVVMISRQSDAVNQDFELLGKYLSKKHKVVYLCKTLSGGVKSKANTRISYGFHMIVQMYHLATSKVCILDSYCPTVSILSHKKSLTIIQIWHSIGTMKRFGYTAINKKEGSYSEIARIMKMHRNYDIVFASSDAYKEHLADGFSISTDKIMTMTLPRIDLLRDKNYEKEIRQKIFACYPNLNKKKNVVYAPTFRKDESSFNKYFNDLVKNFNFGKYNLIVKLHPLSKVKIDNDKVILDNNFSTFEMLFVADKLISDYSCVIYEAGVRDIPLYFYDYDINNYLKARGLALDYKELPGYQSKNAKDLVKSLDKEYNFNQLKKFINKYVTNTKNCTKKAVTEIEKYL